MNKIALVFGDFLVYWNSIIMAFAILAGIVLFWAVFIRRSENDAGAAVLCPLAIVVSFWFARLIHWYFRADSYDGFLRIWLCIERCVFWLYPVCSCTSVPGNTEGIAADTGLYEYRRQRSDCSRTAGVFLHG